ncbi:MAG TPA: 2OG-Fe(II) oxygenase, partial [Acidimicrobiia bacterium]|nr:2OG-Fe(II) oxygenase [Acidimicrobiia bacterium]
TVTKVDTGPLALFHSRAWHDLIADIMGVDATGDVNISLHHHAPGSASGEVHNDLNPGWFVDNGGVDDISVADPALCGYWFGENARGPAYERIRAVAVLLYLANPEWRPGDGGETGLYAAATDPVDRPAAAIPPRNNSLLAFECTPASYHSFLTNRRVRRMSLIMWLHRPKDHVIRRWGEDSIVYWG